MNKFLETNQIMYNKTFNSQWIEIDEKDYSRAVSLFKKMIKLPKFIIKTCLMLKHKYNLFMNKEIF